MKYVTAVVPAGLVTEKRLTPSDMALKDNPAPLSIKTGVTRICDSLATVGLPIVVGVGAVNRKNVKSPMVQPPSLSKVGFV
jgi:hypothetical protein